MRGQKLETKLTAVTTTTTTTTTAANPKVKSSDWLDDADDWGSDEDPCDIANNGDEDSCDIANNGDIGSCGGPAQSYDDPVGSAVVHLQWGSE